MRLQKREEMRAHKFLSPASWVQFIEGKKRKNNFLFSISDAFPKKRAVRDKRTRRKVPRWALKGGGRKKGAAELSSTGKRRESSN